ncbi:MAG: hypothetical protein WDO13_00070 [Verrucomicrobiota bacterium]
MAGWADEGGAKRRARRALVVEIGGAGVKRALARFFDERLRDLR